MYVTIRRNEMTVRDAYTGKELHINAQVPFTTARLLIGDFIAASDTLQAASRQLYGTSSILLSPKVLVHPLEMTEGGLSGIEIRAFHDLAGQVSSEDAKVHAGPRLTDDQVLEILRGA